MFADSGSPLEAVPIPATKRDAVPEGELFAAHARNGESHPACFLGYGRSSRYYDRSPFHLIDHARFALGASMSSEGDLFYAQPSRPVHRCALPLAHKRVLLCLRGSWTLKRYPDMQARVLTRALRSLGLQVSVLNNETAAADGAAVVRSSSTAELRRLLDDHHVFVCVDTFDLHFARHVVGHPTVALFGSTWPGNSDSVRLPESRVLCGPLACTPCSVTDRCLQTHANTCANYPPAHDVVATVLDVFDRVYADRAA